MDHGKPLKKSEMVMGILEENNQTSYAGWIRGLKEKQNKIKKLFNCPQIGGQCLN